MILRTVYEDSQKILHKDSEVDAVPAEAVEEEDELDLMSDSGHPYEDAGIAEGCIDIDPALAPTSSSKESSDSLGNRWEETNEFWC